MDLLWIVTGALSACGVGAILYFLGRAIKSLLVRTTGARLKVGAVEIDTKADDILSYKLVCINQLSSKKFNAKLESAERIRRFERESEKAIDAVKAEVIPRQMRKVELVLDDACRIMKQVHLDAICAKTGKSEDEMRHSSNQYWYITRINSIYYLLKDELRRVMHENHLAGKGAEEIQEYCKLKVQSLFTIVAQEIDPTWDNSILTVEEIRAVQASKIPLYGEFLFNMIIECWKVSKDAANAIKLEGQTLEEKIQAEKKGIEDLEKVINEQIDKVIKTKELNGCDFVMG